MYPASGVLSKLMHLKRITNGGGAPSCQGGLGAKSLRPIFSIVLVNLLF